jgi:hypothetical protein
MWQLVISKEFLEITILSLNFGDWQMNTRFLVTGVLTLFLIVIPPNPIQGSPMSQQLLTNGEFEVYSDGFTNWTIGSFGSWAQVSSPAIAGNSCQLTTSNSVMGDDIVSIWQEIPGQVSTDYFTAVWVYIPNIANAQARLGVRFGSNDATDYVTSIVNDGWELLAYNGTSRSDTTWINIGIDCYADEFASAVFYVDRAIIADEVIPEFGDITVIIGISSVLLLLGVKITLVKRYNLNIE